MHSGGAAYAAPHAIAPGLPLPACTSSFAADDGLDRNAMGTGYDTFAGQHIGVHQLHGRGVLAERKNGIVSARYRHSYRPTGDHERPCGLGLEAGRLRDIAGSALPDRVGPPPRGQPKGMAVRNRLRASGRIHRRRSIPAP